MRASTADLLWSRRRAKSRCPWCSCHKCHDTSLRTNCLPAAAKSSQGQRERERDYNAEALTYRKNYRLLRRRRKSGFKNCLCRSRVQRFSSALRCCTGFQCRILHQSYANADFNSQHECVQSFFQRNRSVWVCADIDALRLNFCAKRCLKVCYAYGQSMMQQFASSDICTAQGLIVLRRRHCAVPLCKGRD